ncbi:MAG: tRNA 2-selenouridine(34) synthase MnmH [Ginsengibacter sp.]
MPAEIIDIENFLNLSEAFPVIDVRSPGEYLHAHIPGAFSVPLFSDDQRKIIGTAYLKESRQIAVNHGLGIFSERMKIIPNEILNIIKEFKKVNAVESNSLLIHCWRGGMRSEAVAWLLNLFGYKIYVLKGGYKSFRRWALSQFEKKYSLRILGGFTGSGKTEVLTELRKRGKNIIDLEQLASHKGSAFGGLGKAPQPSHEMFENLLAFELWRIQNHRYNGDSYTKNSINEIWLEDESVHIGTVGIPKIFWQEMRKSPLSFLDVPFDERVNFIVNTYGIFNGQELTDCILRIQKRLGGLNTRNAIQFLSTGDLYSAFSILLKYYDKMYGESLLNREGIASLLKKIPCSKVNPENAKLLIEE